VPIPAIKGDRTLMQPAEQFDIHPIVDVELRMAH
jgi:hypothetical protein